MIQPKNMSLYTYILCDIENYKFVHVYTRTNKSQVLIVTDSAQ